MTELDREQDHEEVEPKGAARSSKCAEKGEKPSLESLTHGIEAGIVPELGSLPPKTFVTREWLAKAFGRCAATIDRWVKSGELPPPVTLGGKKVWTVGALLRHIENRLEVAMQEHGQEKEKEKETLEQHGVGG